MPAQPPTPERIAAYKLRNRNRPSVSRIEQVRPDDNRWIARRIGWLGYFDLLDPDAFQACMEIVDEDNGLKNAARNAKSDNAVRGIMRSREQALRDAIEARRLENDPS